MRLDYLKLILSIVLQFKIYNLDLFKLAKLISNSNYSKDLALAKSIIGNQYFTNNDKKIAIDLLKIKTPRKS